MSGAGGFVGASLVRRLLADGHRVCALLRPGGPAWRLGDVAADVDRVEVDLLDSEATAAAVRSVRPEWAFHLAAFGGYSWEADRRRIIETNLLGTVGLLEACASEGVEAFVHAGSSSEYGFKDHAPGEDELLEPNSDYAVGKAAATLFCRYVAQREGVRAVTLRLYSAYGPWEEPKRLLPTLIAHALRGELPPLVNPDVARDFVYVEDVAEAFVLAAAKAPAGRIYNVGTGVQTTIEELVALVRRILPVEDEPQWGSMDDRVWDTGTWVANAALIRHELGWEARSDLEEGLRRTIEWLQAAPELWERYGVSL